MRIDSDNVFWWDEGVPMDQSTKDQVANMSKLPFIWKHISIMPDAHCGKGSTVGAVIPTHKAIIPSAVGVDIGCGMNAVRTSLTASQLPDSLSGVRAAIEKAVPHGRTDNGGANDSGSWGEPTADAARAWADSLLGERYDKLVRRHPKVAHHRPINQLGSLGTGNHFIEVCLDDLDRVWVVLHSGSRGVGNRIGSYFIERAKLAMERYFISLPDKDLSYLPEGTDDYFDYISAVKLAQDYASANRSLMMKFACRALNSGLGLPDGLFLIEEEHISCHHNYVSVESHYGRNVNVTRKGALCARRGLLGIIPGSMGDKSFIVRGKGNKESFHSCSHGAGRIMSRTEARKNISLEQHAKATEGVECKKDESVLDESPGAYKPIDAVMAAQSDLVDVVHTLKQVVCVKG